jgi:hypothetical protein
MQLYDPITNEDKILPSNKNIPQKAYSFGTNLRTTSAAVNELAKRFRTVKQFTARQLPSTFDGRVVWNGMLTPILDQGSCGSCWSTAAVTCLADRFSILTLGQIKFEPSQSDLTMCGLEFDAEQINEQWKNVDYYKRMDDDLHANRACFGASLIDALGYLFVDGVTDSKCFPAANVGFKHENCTNCTSSEGGVVNPYGPKRPYVDLEGKYSDKPSYDVPATENSKNFPYCYLAQGLEYNTCLDNSPMRRYKAKTCYLLSSSSNDIKNEIYRWGPVLVGFQVYEDFLTSYNGKTTYKPSTNARPVGGHAVVLYGWGKDSNSEFWIARNSWGKDWGDNGYFYLDMNNPQLMIEENACAMLPDFPGMIVLDKSVVAVETDDQIKIRNFTGRALNPNTGYFTNGRNESYLPQNSKLPDYTTFYAADARLNSPTPLQPPSPTPTPPPAQSQVPTNPTPTPVPSPTTNNQPSPTPAPKSDNSILIIGVILLLIVVIILIFVYIKYGRWNRVQPFVTFGATFSP